MRVPHECSEKEKILWFTARDVDSARLYELGLFPLRCPHCGHMLKPNIMKEHQDEHNT